MVAILTRMRVVALALALALAGGLLTLALLAKPTQGQAVTFTDNERIPFTFEVTNPCTGELVVGKATQHLVFHVTQDPNGGFHFKGHSNVQGRGVSESGAKYVVHESSNLHDNFRVISKSATNFTFTGTLQFIRQGSAAPEDDFRVKATFHVTINANGEVTSEVAKFKEECK
jgi:hypothetical protein